jgi:hypothetical protein
MLRETGFLVTGFFYRNNIHPYTECLKRQQTLEQYAKTENFEVIWQQGYALENFLQNLAFREANRCLICYHQRLQATAEIAVREGFDAFTTTLLYSKYQKHDAIRTVGENIAQSMGILFYYQDFREGWKEGVAESKRMGMYRQPYCGCIYSEKERYFRP